MALRISIRSEYGEEKILRFEESSGYVRFGRALENEVVLSGPYVSRHHGEFVFEGGHWCVVDRGSRTGTTLRSPDEWGRDQHLASRRSDPLRGGEEIRILFSLSAANGDKFAARYRNEIAKRMTSAQIVKAQKLAREWRAKHPKKK